MMRRWWRDDRGQSSGPAVLVLLIVALSGWGFLAWLGRLNSSAQDLTNTAQSAARAASQKANPADAEAAANAAVQASGLARPCSATPVAVMTWNPGPQGTWLGGSVKVTLTCQITNREAFAGIGRQISASDTQVVDKFRAGA
jgi:Flp pilus assembly protein TadG